MKNLVFRSAQLSRCIGRFLSWRNAVLAGAAILGAFSASAQTNQIMLDGALVNPHRILVKYKDQAQVKAHSGALAQMGLKTHRTMKVAPRIAVLDRMDPPAKGESEQGLALQLRNRMAQLEQSGLYEYVEPDYIVHASMEPDDSAFVDGTLWGLRNLDTPGADISATNAWDITTGSPEVIVAIIDTGIRYTHQELASQMWVNENEVPGNGIDDDDNGYVDDIHGINAILGSGDPFDDNSHGTHCSGTIGAAANDDNPHVGVAWQVRLMGCKFLGESGSGNTSDSILCIDYAVANGARILNNSWGGGSRSQALFDSIVAAGEQDVLFVAAAGNDANNNDLRPSYPASYPAGNIIAVAALDRYDNMADFSNYGASTVHIGAPGVDIFSSTADSDISYSWYNGTSMAAPHVSGVAALVLAADPEITVAILKDRILKGAVSIASLAGKTSTGGRVNALRAIGDSVSGVLQGQVSPPSGSTLLRGSSQPIYVTLTDRFRIRDATVTAQVLGVTNLTLIDSGVPPDVTASNGVYSATLQVPVMTNGLTMIVRATAPGKVGFTNTIVYNLEWAPPNDHFTNATKAPAAGTTYLSNNRFATLEPGEPMHHSVKKEGASLWWSWSPSRNTNVFVETTGSSVENVLAVYTGTSVSSLTRLYSTNSNLIQHRGAMLGFTALSNTTYRIAVASANSNLLGSVRLRIAPGGQPDTTPPMVSIGSPSNGAILTNREILVSGTSSDPTPNATGVAEVSMSLNGQLTTTADGTTNWVVPALLAAGQNIITVYSTDAAGNRSSTIREVTYLVPPPPNDYFVGGTPILGSNGMVTANTFNATRQAGEPYHAGNAGGKSVWWTFTPAADGNLILSTTGSGFDTLLGLYAGSDIANLTLVAANDDYVPGIPGGVSAIEQAVRSGQTYRIALDGYDAAGGSAMLHYAYIARPIHHVSVTPTAGGTASPLSADVIHGAELELTAIPDANYQFDLWDGDVVSLSPTLALTVDRDINLNARFSPIAVTDGFETGNLQHLGWTAGGNKPWVVQNIHVATGTWAARSGVIGHGQSSSLILTSNFRAGTGSFTRRVSSEQYYDFLRFYLDGVLMQSWSGEAVWANYTFSITAGTHTLEWRYAKDGSGTSGEDAVFIDNVILPIIVSPDATTPADLTLRQLSDGSYFVELEGQANQQYVMQSSTNLASWQNLSTNIATSGHIYVPLPASSRPVQYYRAVVFP